jgi:hypothetical protein
VQVENQENDSGYEPSEQELERYATEATSGGGAKK